MDELIRWLLAQVDEDERGAQAAFSGQADPENGWGDVRTPGYAGVTITPHVGHIHEDVQASHVVRWNPARVLRKVKAARKIIELCATETDETGGKPLAVRTLRLLASEYDDRPGYQESWRP